MTLCNRRLWQKKKKIKLISEKNCKKPWIIKKNSDQDIRKISYLKTKKSKNQNSTKFPSDGCSGDNIEKKRRILIPAVVWLLHSCVDGSEATKVLRNANRQRGNGGGSFWHSVSVHFQHKHRLLVFFGEEDKFAIKTYDRSAVKPTIGQLQDTLASLSLVPPGGCKGFHSPTIT